MAEANKEQKEHPVDSQKQYLIEKFGSLIKQIGDGYGAPLQEELIRRLEKTIADFHDEVTNLLEEMRTRSQERYEKLRSIWTQEITDEASPSPVEAEETEEDEQPEMSDWERRLEEKKLQREKQQSKSEEKEKKKKKGLLGLKKK